MDTGPRNETRRSTSNDYFHHQWNDGIGSAESEFRLREGFALPGTIWGRATEMDNARIVGGQILQRSPFRHSLVL